MSAITQLQEWIRNSENIVFFGGAEYLRKAIFLTSEVQRGCTPHHLEIFPLKPF